jgi:hypothetical protein
MSFFWKPDSLFFFAFFRRLRLRLFRLPLRPCSRPLGGHGTQKHSAVPPLFAVAATIGRFAVPPLKPGRLFPASTVVQK